jgi:hypothetical protein
MKRIILIASLIVAMTACAPCCWCSYAATTNIELDSCIVVDNTQMNTPDILLYLKIVQDFTEFSHTSKKAQKFWNIQLLEIQDNYKKEGITKVLHYLKHKHNAYLTQVVIFYEEYNKYYKYYYK